MPKYVTLYNWTDQGVVNAKDTVNRYQAAKQLVESKGGKIETILWTVGPYDLVEWEPLPPNAVTTEAFFSRRAKKRSPSGTRHRRCSQGL